MRAVALSVFVCVEGGGTVHQNGFNAVLLNEFSKQYQNEPKMANTTFRDIYNYWTSFQNYFS